MYAGGMTTREARTHAGRAPASSLLMGGFFLAVFLVCFASVLASDYGYREDYTQLADEPQAHVERMASFGRPINAVLWRLSLQAVRDVERLRYLRLASVLGIALLAWCVFQALAYAGWSRFPSACVAVIACTALPFQVYAAWATCAAFPLAGLAAGLAFVLCERGFEAPRDRRSRALAAAGAVLALLAALAVYQPAAMFFWVFAAAVLLKPDTAPRDMLRRLGWYCAIALAAMLAGFAMYRLGLFLFLVPGDQVRTGLVQDLPAKAAWFLSIYLPNAVNFVLPSPSHLLAPEAGGELSVDLYRGLSDALHRLNPSLLPPLEQAGDNFSVSTLLSAAGSLSFIHKLLDAIIAWGVLAIIGGGLWRYFRGARGERLRKCAIAGSLLLLSSLPSLAVEENSSGYRAMPALASLVVLFAYLAFRGYAGRAAASVRAHAVLGVAAAACAVSAAWHVQTCLVAPHVRELALMRSALEGEDLSRTRGIRVIRPPPWQWNPPAPLLWREFGATSSASGPAPRNMAVLLLRERAPEHAGLPIEVVDFDDPTALPPPPDVLVVDMRRIGG